MNWATGCFLAALPLALNACVGSTESTAPVSKPVRSPSPAAGSRVSCRLPLVQAPPGPSTTPFQTVFVEFPSGAVVIDPNGAFQQNGDLYTSVASPHLTGIEWPSWDRASSRWLPAQPNAVSPDGKRYAYAVAGPGYPQTSLHPALHIVEIATGKDTTLGLPAVEPFLTWGVVSYRTEGIYLRKLPYEGNSPPGVWLLDPATGSVRPASEADALPSPLGSAVWKAVLDPGDAKPVINAYSGEPFPDELVRQDGQSGEKVVWFHKPGTIVDFVGLDSVGRPIVLVASGQSSSDSVELRLVAAPGAGEVLSSSPDVSGMSQLIADAHAVWFSGPGGVFTYTSVGGFKKIPGLTGQLGGKCS